ncbi:MAG: DUF983 domain-containing protein [Sciscionella sp.]
MMTLRWVEAADGRQWELESRVAWSSPATADDFEHDVAGGNTPMVVLSVLLLLLIVVLIAWTPSSVYVPGWLVAILILLLGAFPLRWALRRPRSLVARTEEDPDTGRPAEHWVGTLRGPFATRNEASRVARSIQERSGPDIDGALQPVE